MPEKRLGASSKLAILTLAIFADGCGFVPLIGGVLSLPFVGGVYLVYTMNGVPILGNQLRNWVRTFGTLILEQIPIVSMLPIYTLSVLLTIRTTDLEDREAQERYTESIAMANSSPRRAGRMRERVSVILLALTASTCSYGGAMPVVHAQVPYSSPTVTTLSLSPPAPEPFTTVELTLTGYSVDLKTSFISWKKDGVVFAEGTGLVTTNTQVGGEKSVTTLVATITPLKGQSLTLTKTVQPSAVALVWEANSYVPPFYQGKALLGPGGSATFVALPRLYDSAGNMYDPKKLVYTWRRNGQVLASASGYGKQTLTILNDKYFIDLQIGVEVTTLDKTRVAKRSVTVPVNSPELLLYEYDPLLGTMPYTLAKNPRVEQGGVIVLAEPYYTSALSRDGPELAYTWTLNGSGVPARSSLELRPEGTGAGTSVLTASVRNTDYVTQTANASVSLTFDTTWNSSGASSKSF